MPWQSDFSIPDDASLIYECVCVSVYFLARAVTAPTPSPPGTASPQPQQIPWKLGKNIIYELRFWRQKKTAKRWDAFLSLSFFHWVAVCGFLWGLWEVVGKGTRCRLSFKCKFTVGHLLNVNSTHDLRHQKGLQYEIWFIQMIYECGKKRNRNRNKWEREPPKKIFRLMWVY